MKSSYISYRTVVKTSIITAVIMLVLLYAPSPFVVMKPGIAVPVKDYVTSNAKAGVMPKNESSSGELLLTAVLLTTPSIWETFGSIFAVEEDIRFKRDVLGGTSVEKFSQRVTTMMQGSHHDALEAAYQYLNIPYTVETKALMVQQESTSIFSRSTIKAGDRILSVKAEQEQEVTPVTGIAELIRWIRNQNEGEINVYVERGQEEIQIATTVSERDQSLSDAELASIVLGVESFIELRAVEAVDKTYEVEIMTNNIGGPSAGLVIALQIIDELTDGDLTNGSKVAVTGIIDKQGLVGAIGGIQQKVFAVNEQGAEMFIVPMANEEEAQKMARKIKSEMAIVGVRSLEEAIHIITSLHTSLHKL